jgi:diadenosine tetraphosphate (Ap4A) HIT family hydrolase
MTLAQNDPCVLCEMVAGREEASPAYEDEHVIAVMGLSPVTEGHLFVFPRAHRVTASASRQTGASAIAPS